MASSLGAIQSWAQTQDCISLEKWPNTASESTFLNGVAIDTGDLFTTVQSARFEGSVGKPLGVRELQERTSELSAFYASRGFFGVKTAACLQSSESRSGAMDLLISVSLGERAYIRNITFSGVKAFSNSELESALLSKRKSVMTQLLGKFGYGALSEDEDKARIVEFYQARGYLDARVVSFRTIAADDLSFIDLEIAVEEGKPYRVGNIEPIEWRSRLSIKEGDIFDLPSLTQDIERLLLPLKDQGYAFAKATPELKLEGDVLSVRYQVEKGSRIIIGKIRARGQELSNEYLITREFQPLEGKIYNETKIESMRLKLLSTGIFSDAHVSLVKTPIDDIFDLMVSVNEVFPIRFSISPYYASGEGLLLSAYVLHQNLLGLGVFGVVSFQVSSLRRMFELFFYEPRIGGKTASWLTEVHHRQLGYYSFTSLAMGAGARSYWRLSDMFTAGFGLNIDEVSATTKEAVQLYEPYVAVPNGDTRSSVFLATTIQPWRDPWDENQLFAIDAKLTYAGPVSFSDLDFSEIAAGLRWGFTLSPFILRGRLSGAYLIRSSDAKVPITERYFLGGPYNLRGYGTRTIAPWIEVEGGKRIQIGGVSRIQQTIEVELPLMRFLDLRGYVFTDMGNAYSEEQKFFEDGIAWSLGIGFLAKLWRLPLKMELAIPVVNRPGAISFDFYLGLAPATW